MNILYLAIICIILSVAAQFTLKAGMSSIEVREALSHPLSLKLLFSVLTNHLVIGGLMMYCLGAMAWLGVLSRWDVSKAYPLVGLGFALTVIIGFLLGEQVTLLRTSGVILICTGVFLISRS